ncbi:MAG: hypothetical protein SPG09_11285 [Lachnospiraceae bacterium]|nr:hypothetical protein [bacterium]MDY5518173.1 hypothetical protein [Lachnospiraceae bacterium]
MTTLLEIKERIRGFCSKYEVYLVPMIKSILAFLTFFMIRSRLGYMTRLNSMTLLLVLALSCALLPVNAIVLFAAVLVLLHLYSLSLAACAVSLLVILVLFLLYFRLLPKKGYYAVLTPLAFIFQVPYVMPIVIGLLDDNPVSVLAMVCGGIVYYLLSGIAANASAIAEMKEDDTIITKFSEVLNQFIGNREMIAVLAILVVAALIVWFIRRMAVDHAWTIAIATGCLLQFVLWLICDLQLKLPANMLFVFAGVLASAVIGLILQFFFFNLDYTRTERVQFEDDEYYYYVKAVPKIYVANTEKKVKKFSGDDKPITRKDLAQEMDIDENLLDF